MAVRSWGEALLSSLAGALALFFGAIPKVIGFLVILVIGWMIAGALASAAAALLRSIRFNDLAQRSGVSGFVQQMGVRKDPAGVLADVAKWFVRLIVLVVAFDALGLPAVSQVLREALLWLPNLVVAMVILVLAGLAANALANLVRGATGQAGLGNPDLLANIARVAVMGFAIVVAANQIGIAASLVNTLFGGLVGALALALGLAFGLGGEGTARQLLSSWYSQGQAAAPKMAAAAAAAQGETGDSDDGRPAMPAGGDRSAMLADGESRLLGAPAGASALGMAPQQPRREYLPLQAERQPTASGLLVRLPVRAEYIDVDKQAMVTEQVTVRPRQVEEVVRVEETVRREEVRIETEGDVDIAGQGGAGLARDDTPTPRPGTVPPPRPGQDRNRRS